MIAAGIVWEFNSRFDLLRIPSSLGLLSGGGPLTDEIDGGIVAELADPGQRAVPGWRVTRTRAGTPVLLKGWIDNIARIAADLGLPSDTDPAIIYGTAVEAWGLGAERRIIGNYAAIMLPAVGRMRLSRAPWSSAALFWACERGTAIAASIPRPIFAAGFPKRPDLDYYAEAMSSLAYGDDDRHFFEGLHRVRQGTVVTIDRGQVTSEEWYDPHALSPTRFSHDRDYVAVANGLLSDAVSAALRPARRPGILLSGGLDSPLVAAEALRQMPAGQHLASFTFEPMEGDHGPELPAHFHSDRPAVEAFAAMHPRLDPHFVNNRGIGFGHRMEDFFLAADAAYPAMCATDFHGPWQAAADAGCDWLLTGDWGNQTFSNDGRYAYLEFLHQGKWIELWRLLRNTPGDERSMLRRLFARALLPSLPAIMRSAVRTLMHGPAPEPLVRKDVAERLALAQRRRQRFGEREWIRTHRDLVEFTWGMSAGSGEISYAVEQLYGLRTRAVPQYRPLIEFCLSIPTDQYVRHGQTRWLARRMAKGRMPEAQRINQRYGRHGVDWHQRNTPRVPDMRVELERIADDPVMNRIIDVDRAIDLLNRWPEKPSFQAQLDIYLPVTAAIIAGRFSRYVDGRN